MASYAMLRDWERFGPLVLRHPALLGLDLLIGAVLLLTASPASPLGYAAACTPLLAGLLSHVGLRDERTRDYQGARGARFSIQPGPALFRKQPDYVMAAELVETSRLWARTNAPIDPRWAGLGQLTQDPQQQD